jgi:single-strand DNA-binding protein
MSETFVTLWGNIATDPKHTITQAGTPLTKFRLACTPSRRDPATGEFTDGVTSFYTVTCWRDLGVNAAASLYKGQPVVVHGRQTVRDWEADERKGTEVAIDATSVGHDLRWGQATYTKIRRNRMVVADSPGYGADPAGYGDAAGYVEGGPTEDLLAAGAAPLTDLEPGAVDRSGWDEVPARGAA